MHIDARTLPNGSLLEGDVCIVGAGAAGISLALEWAASSHSVLLLEGGGFQYEPAMQDLYRGAIIGLPLLPAAGRPITSVRWHDRPLGGLLLHAGPDRLREAGVGES